jgi:hypothetical protein
MRSARRICRDIECAGSVPALKITQVQRPFSRHTEADHGDEQKSPSPRGRKPQTVKRDGPGIEKTVKSKMRKSTPQDRILPKTKRAASADFH